MPMEEIELSNNDATAHRQPTQDDAENGRAKRRVDWRAMLGSRKNTSGNPSNRTSMSDPEHHTHKKPAKWSMGMLNDRETDEVPGSVLLLSEVSEYNAPLGLDLNPARMSASSLPSPYLTSSHRSSFFRRKPPVPEKKRTADGKIILEPQPDDSLNDPLNWRVWRRNLALGSLGFYCMVGGGMTPILAAGFNEVATQFHVPEPRVALTTGLYMLGLGVGSAILSPTAILYGKRPVYLCAAICFILTSVWCALSPDFPSLVIARVFMGIAVSSVECLPSATVAEIFFLHEKAYRLGIYTLLLLGGKNLVPLVSAVIIQSLGWRWVFWIVAMVVGLGFVLLFFFVPETFWDRAPKPRKHGLRRFSSLQGAFRRDSVPRSASWGRNGQGEEDAAVVVPGVELQPKWSTLLRSSTDELFANYGPYPWTAVQQNSKRSKRVAQKIYKRCFEAMGKEYNERQAAGTLDQSTGILGIYDDLHKRAARKYNKPVLTDARGAAGKAAGRAEVSFQLDKESESAAAPAEAPRRQADRDVSPVDLSPKATAQNNEYFNEPPPVRDATSNDSSHMPELSAVVSDPEQQQLASVPSPNPYTESRREQPELGFVQSLRPYAGRLTKDRWIRVAIRPFILFTYPSILWSALVYSLSVGWLIVLSESVSTIYEHRDTYNFNSLQTGLVYISPFVGGILGTVVAGKVSDRIVRFLSRRNGGVYEPEFRLVMGLPIAIFTTIGLMGYGWSAAERDLWIVPTVFFGFISFGCTLGSTTAITFAVDSYRQYAGEALVTLNFSKNIFHGLVFSLFFNRWLDADGSRTVFIALGGIQLACLLTTIPMYIYGKRARMWTVRCNRMERF